jgi:alcohol dehydrogenase class IV
MDRYDAFAFDYQPGEIRYGRNCVADVERALAERGAERALIVCGQTVGATEAVIDPVEAGVGDRLVGVFDETTPDKRLRTAHDCAQRILEEDVDALVALGGGSSLDVAKVATVLAEDFRPYEAAFESFAAAGRFDVPGDADVRTLVSVPTTLAGADLSIVAGITARKDEGENGSGVEGLHRGGVSGEALVPDALFYDPALFETTPHGVLCASAMNGFDKAIETAYSRLATPVTDATARHAVRSLARGLTRLGDGQRDDETLHDAVVGTILAQYGVSRGDGVTLSLIHAFGHGVARGYDIQQGGAHGIIAPHALEYLFEQVDARRHLLAEAFGVAADTDAEAAGAVVGGVTEVRDALGLQTRLRDIDDMPREDLPAIAESVLADGFVPNAPEDFEPTKEGILGVLEDAW